MPFGPDYFQQQPLSDWMTEEIWKKTLLCGKVPDEGDIPEYKEEDEESFDSGTD